MTVKSRAFIGLGSNLGDGIKNLSVAWDKLTDLAGSSVGLSSPYLTEPIGMESDFLFTNAVGLLETSLEPLDLLAVMLDLEKQMGRDRKKGKDRTVDLDLLFYDDRVMNKPSLVLPHPEIANRLFVLAPLAELAGQYCHPVLHKTMAQMLERLADENGVTQLAWSGA